MKLLIVDDSALMRRLLQECFKDERDVEVFLARDGEDALEKMRAVEPDVITLDIKMPRMDGLTCLAAIMETRPCPVVMVSSLTERGAVASFEALELGAVDFVTKPGGTVSLNLAEVFDEIRQKVRAAYVSRRRGGRTAPRREVAPSKPTRQTFSKATATDLVVVGSSTGGPKTLNAILERLPRTWPTPIVIAQHMPPRFTRTFAERLQDQCDIAIRELARSTVLQPGTAYVSAGGHDSVIERRGRSLVAHTVEADPRYTWHPSVSRLTASAIDTVPAERLIGVMLTGMGDDGALEMAEIHKQGGLTIAESEETAVVFGMPQKLIENDGASLVLPYDRIASQLIRWMQPSFRERAS